MVVEVAETAVLRSWRDHASWAQICLDQDTLVVRSSGSSHRWTVRSWPDTTAAQLGRGEVLVAASLGRRMRTQLARRGQSFVDRTELHLVDGDVLVHVERPPDFVDDADRPVRATRPLPPTGVRAIEAMLAQSDTAWTVRLLAAEVDLSVGQAQRILSTLEQADLVVAQGSGTAASRQVRSPGALLDWLAQQPVARATPLQWATHLYGRNGREVLERAAYGLAKGRIRYAVTGMAATVLAGSGPTELATVHVWIDGNVDLASVAADAGMKRVARGANVILWSDADRSATYVTENVDGVQVAPRPRVYLDLLGLPRGVEVAQTYRRVHLGY